MLLSIGDPIVNKKMRLRYGLIILIALTGCSKPKKDNNPTLDITAIESDSITGNPGDSLSFIGYIQKLEDNGLFYTDLYFVDNFNYDFYDEIAKMGDQVVFSSEETKRTRIEIKKAGKYFNLTGLKDIHIFNSENLKLTNGRLSHIEYVDDMIESRFIAVFEVDDPSVYRPLFCIGNTKADLTTIIFSPYEDEKLKAELIEDFKLNTGRLWKISHYKLNNQKIYSTVSCDTTALIIETVVKMHRTLYRSKSSELIDGLTMISNKIHGREILLTTSSVPETDMTWTSVLIFNGKEYEPSKDHRIRLE
ncbi:MAG: hypothetical protein JNM78_16640 [Cyclobacteriaceae bacterium]|nr:hypothetical protein [Cyclobacteriaceae bacterium]